MKTALCVVGGAALALGTIVLIKNVRFADTVPVLGTGIMKVRSLL